MGVNEVLEYLKKRRQGQISQSPEPVKQDKQILTQAEQEIVEEIQKENMKEKLSK
jgi:hypothetical protein